MVIRKMKRPVAVIRVVLRASPPMLSMLPCTGTLG